MPYKTTAAAPVALALAASVLVVGGLHCDGTTGDRRVRFGGVLRGSGADGTTAAGWALHFEQFVVALGPVRLYADEPLTTAARAPRPRGPLRGRFALGVAFAQHCHGCPRAPLAEFGFERGAAVERAVDLLAPQGVDLGPANARTGHYRSVSFAFQSPSALADAGIVGVMLRGHSMVVRGTATRGGVTVAFEGALDLALQDVGGGVGGGDRPYTSFGSMFDNPDGVRIDQANPQTDRVVARVELARMFDAADFAALPPAATPDATRVIPRESQAYTAWRLGAEDPRTYRVAWAGPGGSGEPSPAPPPRGFDAGL